MDMLTLALEVNIKKAVAKTIKIEMEYLCKRIATAYEIDEADLLEFLSEESEGIEEIREKALKGKNPRPAPKKPRAKKDSDEESASGDRSKCAATTAKGLPCKNNALVGCVCCHAHKKQEAELRRGRPAPEVEEEEEEPPAIPVEKPKTGSGRGGRKSPAPAPVESEAEAEEEVKTPPAKPKGKGKAPAAPKKPATKPKGKGKAKPEHDHKPDEDEGECSRCAEHGNPASDGEFTVDSKTKQSLEDILAALEAADMQEQQGDK
jgi:hypothetical protein